ncbi:MAG: response regulator transcription factor [Pirellulaceae bacterium]
MKISVVLGDDQPVVHQGLASYFADSEIDIVGAAKTNSELLKQIIELRPQVVVSEVRLDGQDTMGKLSDIANGTRPVPIVFFSNASEPTPIARALAMSAADYVYKHEDMTVLAEAIRRAYKGIEPDESRPIRQRRVQLTATKGNFSKTSPLTRREIQVLRHVSMGLSNREIGMSLGISVETTKEHVQNILRKLDVNDRTQAAIWALRRELV